MGKKSTVSKKREPPSVKNRKSPRLQRAAGSSTPATAFPEAAVSSPEVVFLSSSEAGSPAASPSPPTVVPASSEPQEVSSPAISRSPAISGLITGSLSVTAPAGLSSLPETPPIAVASCMVGPAISPLTAETAGSTVPGTPPATGSTMGLMSAIPVASCIVSPSAATGTAGLLLSSETLPVTVASVGLAVSSSPATGGSTIPGPTLATGSTMGLMSSVPVASCMATVSPSPTTGGSGMAAVLESPVVVGAVAPRTINNLLATASKNRRKNLRKLLNKFKQRAAALAAENQPAEARVPATVVDSTMATGAVDAVGKCEVEFGGFIFHCDVKTRLECFRSGVFGLGMKKAHLVEKIRAGTLLFLFDIQTRDLNGIYRATGNGGLNLEAEAFDGRFPAQVRFMVEKDCPPVPESVFKEVIKENYVSSKRFKLGLNSQQVNKLLPLFTQSKMQTHSVPSQPPIGATDPSPAADFQTSAVGDPSLPSVTLPAVPRGERKRGRKSSEKKKSNGASVHSGTANGTSEALIEGFIFHCDRTTKPECFTHRIFGLRKKHAYLVEKIRAGTFLFLFDTEPRILCGIYRAAGDGGVNLVPEAFGGKFPAQVRFRIDNECPPVAESVFKDAIKENYTSAKRFSQVLSSQQVNMLLPLFTSSMTHLPPTHLPYFEQPHGARHIRAPPHASYAPPTHHSFDARQLPPTTMPPPNVPSYLAAPTRPYYPMVDPSSLHAYHPERRPINVHGW